MIADAGAITPLVNLLSGSRGDEAQQEAAGALWALADHAVNRTAITEAGGIGPLVMLLGCENAKAREHAELALVRLSIEKQNREIIIEQLVGMLDEERGTALQEQAAAALANLAKESVENRTSILKAKGVPRLLQLLHSNSAKAMENSASAISELAHQSPENQRAIANAGGVAKLVSALINASSNVKEHSGVRLCCVLLLCIWHMSDGSRDNQTSLMKEGAIPPIVTMVTNPDPEMQTNAAGSLACLSRGHADNQAAIARSGAIPPLCTMVREGANETREESARALWALAADNGPNKATIAKLGGIEPLVNMLMFGHSEKSSINAAGALAALAAQHTDNRSIITKRMVNVLGGKAAPARAVRLLSALASLCDNEPTNQVAIAKTGGVQHLIVWLSNSSQEVQVQAARAMLAVSSNNSTTQSLVGKAGGIPPLVTLIKHGILEAQENAACALWHLATLKDNRALIKDAGAIPPLVALLLADGKLAPQVSAMLLVRLAEGSTRAAVAIAEANGVLPLVKLLSSGTPATQQMAAAALAAIGYISMNRDSIANAGAIPPLIKLIWSETLGTPETAARALSFLARDDIDEDNLSVVDEKEREAAAKEAEAAFLEVAAAPAADGANAGSELAPSASGEDDTGLIVGAESRRHTIKDAGGLDPLIKMLDGTNLKGTGKLKPGAVGGWASVRVGVAGAIELQEIFPGSQIDFRIRIGMQEQAASTLGDLAFGDLILQDAIIEAGSVRPLLSLVQCGSAVAQECAARTLWYLATSIHNQHVLVSHKAIPDLVDLVKTGSNVGQEMAAAALSVMAHGYIEEQGGVLKKASAVAPPDEAVAVEGASGAAVEREDAAPAAEGAVPAAGGAVPAAEGAAPAAEGAAVPAAEGAAPAADEAALAPVDRVPAPADAAPPPADAAPAPAEAVPAQADAVPPAEEAAPAPADTVPAAADDAAGGAPNSDDITSGEAPKPADSAELASAPASELPHDHAPQETLIDGEAPAAAPSPDSAARRARRSSRTSGEYEVAKPKAFAANYDDRLMEILDVGGIPPLVKLAEVGTDGGKEKAASALWHLALDPDNQVAIASNGGIKPLVNLLADGTENGQKFASDALTRLATNNQENQAQIAKRLVGLLDYDDAGVVSRAAHDLQALAKDHVGAPVVIVNAGAISPLVGVLSNGKTDEGRREAARTLHTLANSGSANQLAIAVGLVALLGVGQVEAQEYVTSLLLDLSSGLEEDLHNRKAIADAGPFKMLVFQLRSESIKVKMLAAAVMSKLSGDSENNVNEIAKSQGVKPLVALLSADDPETQHHAAVVLADMARVGQEHAVEVAQHGGIPLLVTLLTTGYSVDAKAEAAGALGSIAIGHAVEVGEAGAIIPLVQLLESGNRAAEKRAASALAGIAAGGEKNQDAIDAAGGMKLLVSLLASQRGEEKVASSKPGQKTGEWDVQTHAAKALGALGTGHSKNQAIAAANNALQPIIALITDSAREEPKEQAAFALWRLTSACHANQVAVADAGGISALVTMVGNTTMEGQSMAAEALASLAMNNLQNQSRIAELLITLLKDSPVFDKQREKAARAISKFASATSSNQDALATAGGVKLIVSFLDPQKYEEKVAGAVDAKADADTEDEVKEFAEDDNVGKHEQIQRELSSALWSMAYENSMNQQAFAKAGAIPLLIALTEDDPEIHRDAAGALWSLAADASNQKAIADDEALPRLVDLLKTGKKTGPSAQETASGALRALAQRAENRDLIEQSEGILHLVNLFDGGTELTKAEVTGALLMLVKDNPANQRTITEKLVAMIQSGPDEAREATNAATIAKVAAQEDATNVLYHLSLDRDNREALQKKGSIAQLVRQLKGGSERSQKLSASALTQIARITAELRIHVIQQVVTLLSNREEDVRKRAGAVLQDMNIGTGEVVKHQKEAALAAGVGPLVELLKDGLKHDRIEPQEYTLRSLAITADPKRSAAMVREGVIPALVAIFNGGMISNIGLEHAAHVISILALDHTCHDEVIEAGGLTPLVRLLEAETVGCQKHSAIALARLALGSPELQTMIAEAGALKPLVEWLVPAKKPAVKDTAPSPPNSRRRKSQHPNDRLSHEEPTDERDRSPEERPPTPNETRRPGTPTPNETKRPGSPPPNETKRPGSPPPNETSRPGSPPPNDASPSVPPRMARRPSVSGDEVLQVRRSRQPSVENLEQPVEKKPVPRELKAVSALALADLARDNADLQAAISKAGAMKPLILMLADFTDIEGQKAACSAIATLAQGSEANQIAIAEAGGIPPLVELLKHVRSQEVATRAVAMLAVEDANKSRIAKAGGIEPLVGLLVTGNDVTKKFAAYALESLSQQHEENQSALATLKAYIPLVELLSSDFESTGEHAKAGLLSLADHLASQKPVTKRLVDTLSSKSITAQLKASEALAAMSSRSAIHRTNIVKAGAIPSLVSLLGNGQRADAKTPPERAAAVLADLARIAESKIEIANAGGVAPLVVMLSSSCESSQTNATVALFHMSTVADNKVKMSSLKAIPLFVRILSTGSSIAQHHAAGALWQLATSPENKNAIVEAGGIQSLVNLLTVEREDQGDAAISAPTPRRKTAQEIAEASMMAAQESAAAVLAELARSQSSFRIAIARAGGIQPLVALIMSGAAGAQKHATCAIWGLTAEVKFRPKVCAIPGAVERLVELIRSAESETQGFAAATLVGVANEEAGREEIKTVGGAGPLMTVALGPDSWMRSQCVEVLKLMGYDDPSKKQAEAGGKQHSPRMAKLQEKLAANPDLWMCKDEESKAQAIVNDEHMSDLACKISNGQRVLVVTGAATRQAEVMYVGKIPEIAPGWWIGVQYDEAVGKNDGSIKGERYFDCPPDTGGILRPDRIEPDPDPPPPKVRKTKEDEVKPIAAAPTAEEPKVDQRRASLRRGSVANPSAATDESPPKDDAAVADPEASITQAPAAEEADRIASQLSRRRRSTGGSIPGAQGAKKEGNRPTVSQEPGVGSGAPAVIAAEPPAKPIVRERPKRFSDLIDVRNQPAPTGDQTSSSRPVIPSLSVRSRTPRSARGNPLGAKRDGASQRSASPPKSAPEDPVPPDPSSANEGEVVAAAPASARAAPAEPTATTNAAAAPRSARRPSTNPLGPKPDGGPPKASSGPPKHSVAFEQSSAESAADVAAPQDAKRPREDKAGQPKRRGSKPPSPRGNKPPSPRSSKPPSPRSSASPGEKAPPSSIVSSDAGAAGAPRNEQAAPQSARAPPQASARAAPVSARAGKSAGSSSARGPAPANPLGGSSKRRP